MKNKLIKTIEKVRTDLHKITNEKNCFDECVIKKSKQLDKILLEYYKLNSK